MMKTAPDAELWRTAAAGSDDAFAELFERHSSAVYNFCFRRLGDWAAAEDLMAATFLEAWRKRDQVQISVDSLRPWLLGVANNLLRNERRSNRRREAALRRVRLDLPHEIFEEDVAAKIDDEQRMQQILQLLSQMSVQDQEVIALVLWSGLTYDEAAVALAVPVGTVKSRAARAKKKLTELAGATGHSDSETDALLQQPSRGS